MYIENISSSLFQDVVDSSKGEVVRQLLQLDSIVDKTKRMPITSLTDMRYLDTLIMNFTKKELGFGFSDRTYQSGLSLYSILTHMSRQYSFVKTKNVVSQYFSSTPSLTRHGVLSVVIESEMTLTFDVYWLDTDESKGLMVFNSATKNKELNTLPHVVYHQSVVNMLKKLINIQNSSGFGDTDVVQLNELRTFMSFKPSEACVGVLPKERVVEATSSNVLGSVIARELFDEWMRALRLQNPKLINEYHFDRRSAVYKKFVNTAQAKAIMPSKDIMLVEFQTLFLGFNAKLRIDFVNDVAYVTLL